MSEQEVLLNDPTVQPLSRGFTPLQSNEDDLGSNQENNLNVPNISSPVKTIDKGFKQVHESNVNETLSKQAEGTDSAYILDNPGDELNEKKPTQETDNYLGIDHNNVHAKKTSSTKKTKKIAIIDSDSESDSEDILKPTLDDDQALNPKDENINSKQPMSKNKFRKIAFDDSEDESDNNDLRDVETEELNNHNLQKNKFRLCDSDAEDDDIGQVEQKDELQITKKPKKFVVDSESEDELQGGTGTVKQDEVGQETQSSMPNLRNLCDSESSEGEFESDNHVQSPIRKSNKSVITKRIPKPKKMTAKDALKQRQEIKSESQRMLRESQVSLPYHKPKEHSIKEFLANRPRLSILKSNHSVSASAAIKMTTEELKLATKKMEERETELQKFYESESEPEDEENELATQAPNEENQVSTQEDKEEIDESITVREPVNLSPPKHADDRVEVDETIYIGILGDEKDTINEDLGPIEQEEPMETDEVLTSTESTEALIECETTKMDEPPTAIVTDKLTTTKENQNKSIEGEEAVTLNNLLEKTDSNEQNKIIIHSVVTIPKKSMYELEESMDFDFNLDDIEDIAENKDSECISAPKLSKQDLLKLRLGNFTPCLSGDPDHEIDFEEGTVKPNAVIQLMERFKKHVEVKKFTKNKIKLDIVNLTQGTLHNETVVVPTDNDEEPINATDKPGLRIKKLRNDLQEQIAQQRAELWKQRQQAIDEMTKTDEEKTDDKSDYEDNVLDDEEEAELTESDDTDEDDDIEHIEDTETPKVKSVFIDEEAEESDKDAENEGIEADDESEQNDLPDDSNSTTNEDITANEPKKPLKRIIKAFMDDSDDEDRFSFVSTKEVLAARLDDDYDDDINIPPYQPRPDKTPLKQMIETKSDICFHTPITQLTALQGLNSGSKYLHESPASPFPFPPPSLSVDTPTVKQKLFSDSCDVLQPQADTQELIGLCSGDFSNSGDSNMLRNTQLCTQDLLGICSGSFSELTNEKEESVGISKNTVEVESTNSQSKYLDEDIIISQLLDEEEMEKFKKKFESPVANTSSLNIDDGDSEIKGGGRLVFGSDDDEECSPTVKQSKHKKLDFSDDESDDEQEEADEEIDLHDDDDEDEEEEDAERVVDYDSEENEIEAPKVSYKPSEFFEREAELSESDWDSADEDERGLDVLEKDQADDEVFDEDQIRNDLEKIHMRNVLDQDNREIKILQELLLEDGELHGTGRQRQFRWKNMDDNANDDRGPGDGDDVYLDEDESEENWRKVRHEREMFLKSQNEKRDEDDIDCILSDSNSQLLKIGKEILQRSISNSSGLSEKEKSLETTKRPSLLMNTTRGSFLARSDNFLTKLAGITKVNNASTVIKTSTKIVFQTSTSIDEGNSESNKRKADDGTPIAIKKLRLSSNISPSLKGVERKKKLF